MRKLILSSVAGSFIILATTVSTPSFAFGHGMNKGEMSERMLERLERKLDLSPEQVESIKDLNADLADEAKESREQLMTAREELEQLSPKSNDYEDDYRRLAKEIGEATTDMVEIKSEHRQKLAEILTDEQFEELSELKEEHKDKWREKESRFGERRFGEGRFGSWRN